MIEQGSAEWLAQRLGKVTASRIGDLMARTKTGYGASRANYAAQLVAERLTGASEPSYTSKEMQWGTEQEPFARDAYAFVRDHDVELAGFHEHPLIPMSGASPDGLVGSDGLVEIKCPNTATHIETLVSGTIAGKYLLQMQWQMACTERQWCDFVSFDPRLPPSMQLWVKRVPRDDAKIAEIAQEVRSFLSEVEATVATLRRLYEPAEAA